MIRRSLLEWQSLAYGESEECIPGWAADRLVAVARRSPLAGKNGKGILEHGRHALGARQVVGVIVADGCALEILPKIDTKPSESDPDNRGYLRDRLVHMLAVALDLEIDSGTLTALGSQRDTLLEVLIGLFSRKLADALRQGMPRRYMVYEDELPALRGRLDVVRQFTRLAASPQRLACRFDELSPDTAVNQIMKAAVFRLLRVSNNADNQRRLAELGFAYADIADVPVSGLRWDDVHLDRTNARWKELITLARLLLGDRFQTSSMGRQDGFSLLFEMNTLFEEYVGRLLKRALSGTGFSVSLQGGRLFCLENETDGRQVFQTRPDILVKRGNAVVQIIDTKWKRISSRIDDPKQGVSQADVYQMMAYGQIYHCDCLSLLYPHHFALADSPGALASHRIGADQARLHTMSVELGSRQAVIQQLRQLTLEFAEAEVC